MKYGSSVIFQSYSLPLFLLMGFKLTASTFRDLHVKMMYEIQCPTCICATLKNCFLLSPDAHSDLIYDIIFIKFETKKYEVWSDKSENSSWLFYVLHTLPEAPAATGKVRGGR